MPRLTVLLMDAFRTDTEQESRMTDDGKHAGPPSDKPWIPPPSPPSPDGSGPKVRHWGA
jgi:hypothetical protein